MLINVKIIKKILIYVKFMIILCKFMQISQTNGQTDKHIKSIVRNLTKFRIKIIDKKILK
jgi:hypothetical protein